MNLRIKQFKPSAVLRTVIRLVKRRRRLLAAIFFCAAAAVAVNQLAPASQSSQNVLSAAQDLPAGRELSVADLVKTKAPPELVFDSALSRPEEALGRKLASPLRKGQLIADTSLVGQGLLTGAAPGSSAVPLRLADPAIVQLLSPGQLVTVLSSADDAGGKAEAGIVLATAVPVLWTQGKSDSASAWPAAKDSDGLVVVAASTEQAKSLAGASARGKLSLVLVGAG